MNREVNYAMVKEFNLPSEAIAEISSKCYSLAMSDLDSFRGANSYEEFSSSWNKLKKDGGSWATISLTTTESDADAFSFFYRTASGVNSLTLYVQEEQTTALYEVVSSHSVRDSSIVHLMIEAGWSLQEVDCEEQMVLEHIEDERRKEEFLGGLERGRLYSGFYVNFTQTPMGWWSVDEHHISINPAEDIRRMKLFPECRKEIVGIAKCELQRVLFIPEKYEFNEEFKKGGEESYYAKKFAEYKDALRQIIAAGNSEGGEEAKVPSKEDVIVIDKMGWGRFPTLGEALKRAGL